ncbi:MAG: hypothetical protein ACREIC_19285 [Limisphaerales bacterium]
MMGVIVSDRRSQAARWGVVAVYAVAMAWVEAAVVFYLRTMVGRLDPYQPDPLPMMGGLGEAELVREAATLLMLLTVGILAGNTWRRRLGYSAISFGLWDIFYYVFLRVLCGRPHSLADWDILFLLPLPWWGPVWAPVSIACLMILWGTLVIFCQETHPPLAGRKIAWAVNSLGIALALCVFMTDTARVAGQGTEAVRAVLPKTFNWPLFGIALGLMAAPILQMVRGFARPGPGVRVAPGAHSGAKPKPALKTELTQV